MFTFPQKYSFHTNVLLTLESFTILAFTGEISLLWKLISLRTEMLHMCILLPKSRKIANICSDPLFLYACLTAMRHRLNEILKSSLWNIVSFMGKQLRQSGHKYW